MESNLAITLHYQNTLETRWAFHTRVLDYIWAGLPMVATCDDATSEVVQEYDLGTLVSSQDVDDVADAILHTLNAPRENYHQRFDEARKALTWEQVTLPLIEFCDHPKRAPDKLFHGKKLGDPFYLNEITRLKK